MLMDDVDCIATSDIEFYERTCGMRRSMVWHGRHVEYFMDEVSAKDAGIPDGHPEFKGWRHAECDRERGYPDTYHMIVFMEDPFSTGKSPHPLGRWRLAFPFGEGGIPRSPQEQAREFLDRLYPKGAEGSAEPGPSSESGWMDRRREREEARKADRPAWEAER